MVQTDLMRIDKAVDIQAPPEAVWRALTDPVELSAWFRVTIEGVLAPGEARLTVSETGFDAIALTRRARVFGDNDKGWMEVLEWLRTHVEEA